MLINFTDPMFSNRVLGFETLVDRLERISNESQSGYPPYNIFKDGLKFKIEIALAGIDKKDVDIELCDGVLTIKHDGPKEDNSAEEALHKGIAKRAFKLKFTLAEDLEVLGAAIKNGLLTVNLERVVPDHKKPRVIEVK
ncbi:Hsp20 family protein [SAR86 cluster bacterium]|jgi:molecular chaperone IbpA|nr:heat-shock protein [Gammaproteobacteria bacterium]URQ63875.1 Hsp20 family protein [SAR86 cluster bacterium]|tara:strand:- start:115 stop:531 length:417 start_codon:yes stop_codon:yes gene_type:complete